MVEPWIKIYNKKLVAALPNGNQYEAVLPCKIVEGGGILSGLFSLFSH